jgi:plastocyanin
VTQRRGREPREPRALRASAVGTLLVGLLLAACSGSAGSTKPPAGACVKTDASNSVTLTADNLQFSTTCIEALVGKPIVIHFTNREAVPHDIAVYKDSSKKDQLEKSEIVTGPNASTSLTIASQQPGQLYFECTVHPTMNGSLVVRGDVPAS